MMATLEVFEHRCTEYSACGDVIEVTDGGNSLVRKTILRVDGKPKYVGTRQGALDYATANGLEVVDGN